MSLQGFRYSSTPQGLLSWAVAISAAFWMAKLFGFRDSMSVISMTVPEGETESAAIFRSVVYLILHFGWVLGVPILVISAVLLEAWLRISKKQEI